MPMENDNVDDNFIMLNGIENTNRDTFRLDKFEVGDNVERNDNHVPHVDDIFQSGIVEKVFDVDVNSRSGAGHTQWLVIGGQMYSGFWFKKIR